MLMRWPEDGVGKEVCLASEVDAELARLTTERDAAIAERDARRQSLANEIRGVLDSRGLFSGGSRSCDADIITWVAKAIDSAIARAERAERVAVWAVKHDAKHRLNVRRYVDEDNGSRLIWHKEPGWSAQFVEIPKGNTDAGIYRALVEACEGGDDSEG